MGESAYAIVGALVLLQVLQCVQLIAILRAVRRSTLRPPPLPVERYELPTPLELERSTPWRRVVDSVRPRRRKRRTLDGGDDGNG